MGQLDYALIGNCQVSALLDREARYVRSCMPRFDSPALFASLLGKKENGIWSCVPEAEAYHTKQHYLYNSNVLQTEFLLKNGDQFYIIDFAPRFFEREGYFRPPQFIRIVRIGKGNPRVRMWIHPKFDYGRAEPEIALMSDGIVYEASGSRVFLQSNVPLAYLINGQSFELTRDSYFVLSHGEPFARPLKFGCEEYFERTASYWRSWVKHSNIPFEYQERVIRSALALKLHIFEDTGAIIAATTTSIPESPQGGRNWDYRYCWLRDAYFVINVLNQLGHFEEMERFIQFLHNIASTEPDSDLQPVYGIGGERVLEETKLPWLEGFNGLGPVRIGNAAYAYAQYDIYGEMELALTPLFFDTRLDQVDLEGAFDNVKYLVEKAIFLFDQPDRSI